MPFTDQPPFFKALLAKLQPPAWLARELQQRLVLLLNHVLMQEPIAQERLQRQRGKVVKAQWLQWDMALVITPAGLFDLAEAGQTADLSLQVLDDSPLALVRKALSSDKPALRIEGDVQLAADINWLADHVRWDLEEDLSRVVGDVPAHRLAQLGRRLAATLRGFVSHGTNATARP